MKFFFFRIKYIYSLIYLDAVEYFQNYECFSMVSKSEKNQTYQEFQEH